MLTFRGLAFTFDSQGEPGPNSLVKKCIIFGEFKTPTFSVYFLQFAEDIDFYTNNSFRYTNRLSVYILGRLSKLIFFILEGTDYFGCEAPLVPMRDIILAETVDVVLDEDVPKLSFSLLTDNGEKLASKM